MRVRFLVACLAAGFIATTCYGANPVPKLDGDWWRIASNPDLGELTSPKQQPVDFAVWQAADGTWQLWSCIRHTKEGGHTRLFHAWQGKALTDSDWSPRGVVMRAKPELGEVEGGLQAPYVVKQNDSYVMFYGDWERIRIAFSSDGKEFTRSSAMVTNPADAYLFSDGIGNNTRDPMLIEIGGVWHCYYCAERTSGGFFVRRSKDLLGDWGQSKPIKVCSLGRPGKNWWQAECPHVVEHDGWFFLFRTSRYDDEPITTVYRSRDHLDFGIDDDSKIVATLPLAAPEYIRVDGQDYLAALTPQLDGIRIVKLRWDGE
ncbi:hypothetical protein [Stratiformator vulcanicus]|uniref:Glycosyl hydrolases family 43 n=1 Tax=Stratiformator vulcanicus TaxID=2527980 RepID=A0A517QXK8_9PLAN|nr:hypothetical protein [Stratiformator vulcanicus]QDT36385.1 Glycosyl hydrolases family 43 [Stratiformator vulcanicus]